MKNKWIIFGILLAVGMIFAGPQNAQAGTWAIASIDQVGQHLDNGIVVLTHVHTTPVFTAKWFKLNPASAKQMLAVALTAQSLGKKITIEIAADNLTIERIYTRND